MLIANLSIIVFLVWASLTNIALYIIDNGLVSQAPLKDRVLLDQY